jgi:hypothetical protein
MQFALYDRLRLSSFKEEVLCNRYHEQSGDFSHVFGGGARPLIVVSKKAGLPFG